MVAQDLPDVLVAPGGCGAAVKQAVGKLVLAAGDGALKGCNPMLVDVAGHSGLVGSVGRPVIGQHQGVQGAVGLVHRQRLGKVLKVTVQVDVFLRHAALVRKTMRVEGVHIQHGHALGVSLPPPGGVAQCVDLHAAAAKALHTMAGAADNQQLLGIGRAVQHHVSGQGLAVAAGQRVRVRLHRQPGAGRSRQKLGARLGVAVRKSVGLGHGATVLRRF